MSRLPFDEYTTLHTVARETIDRPEEPGVYRARLTPAGKRVLLVERARLDAEP